MDARPAQILDAATTLFDVEGVGVSTAKIAKSAGVSNGTLFHHFPTKQDLLDALYVRAKTGLAQAIGEVDEGEDLRAQVLTVFLRWVAWSKDDPVRHRVTNLLVQSGLASEQAVAQAEPLFAASGRMLAQARADGLIVDLPDAYVAGVLHAHVDLAVACDLDEPQQRRAFDAMWVGLLADAHHTARA